MLAFADALPKQVKVGVRMVKFLVKNHAPPKIILIAHDNCSRYLDGFSSWMRRANFSLAEKQKHDLETMRSDLLDMFPGTKVEAFFARAVDGGAVIEFEAV